MFSIYSYQLALFLGCAVISTIYFYDLFRIHVSMCCDL